MILPAFIIAGLGASVVLPPLSIAIVKAIGFTAGGVAAGSLAAGIQSSVYGGATCGIFSVLQSIGATGVIFNPILSLFATLFGVVPMLF